MFSGIISAVSKIRKRAAKNGSLFLTVQKPKNWRIKPGDSVCSDGACLTVKKVYQDAYLTELMPETLAKTYFGLAKYDYLNLERPLKLNGALDGHLVTGHLDAMGKIKQIETQGDSKIYKINFPKKFAKYLAEKGSLAVDGISLTVVNTGSNWFTVSLVDYTLQNTAIERKKVGDLVHLEFDILAKYLEKLIRQ